ncbi:hypothetical protein LT493_10460 [Streptomyces tricolor]|nr:hypothetical protein [Streptomyces tricolor]
MARGGVAVRPPRTKVTSRPVRRVAADGGAVVDSCCVSGVRCRRVLRHVPLPAAVSRF